MGAYQYRVEVIDHTTWKLIDPFFTIQYLVEGDNKAALIDTGMGIANLYDTVRRLTNKPVIVLNTHGHFDHTGGNYAFDSFWMNKADIPVMEYCLEPMFRLNSLTLYAQEIGLSLNEKKLQQMITQTVNHNQRNLDETVKIDLGGRTLSVIETPGHTPGCVCIYDMKKEYLFTGDTICEKGVLLHALYSMAVETFLESIQHLKNKCLNVDTIWPGHHSTPSTAELLDNYMICAQTIMNFPDIGAPICTLAGNGMRFQYKNVALTYQMDRIYKSK